MKLCMATTAFLLILQILSKFTSAVSLDATTLTQTKANDALLQASNRLYLTEHSDVEIVKFRRKSEDPRNVRQNQGKETKKYVIYWNKKKRGIVEVIKDVELDVESSLEKTSHVKSCHFDLIQSMRQLKRAIQALERTEPQFQTGVSRLRWARAQVTRCQSALKKLKSKNPEYHGEAEMGVIKENLKELISKVTKIASEYNVMSLLEGSPLISQHTNEGGVEVKGKGSHFFLSFDGASLKGSRVQSTSKFTSGIFSAQIQCPEEGSGLNTAFFLSTDLDKAKRSSIFMEFNGENRSIVALGLAKDGIEGNIMYALLGYDCAQNFHTYSISWTSTRIIWRNEKSVLRIIDLKLWDEEIPTKPMHLFLDVNLVNTVGLHPWRTKIQTWGVNSLASFLNVNVKSPIVNRDIPKIEKLPPHSPWYPVGINYGYHSVLVGQNKVSITFEKTGFGGRVQTTTNFMYGQFSAQIKCPVGDTSGLVTAFYLSTSEGDPSRDEIDLEFLGYTKTHVQTNIFVSGTGNHEVLIDLGFDCSKDFHTYAIRYTKDSIVWFVDGVKKREYFEAHEAFYPKSPMFLYASLWNASYVLDGWWAGNWTGVNAPYTAQFKSFEINSPWLGKQ